MKQRNVSRAVAGGVRPSANGPRMSAIAPAPTIRLKHARRRHADPCLVKPGVRKNAPKQECYDRGLREDEKFKCDTFGKARWIIAARGYPACDCDTLDDLYSEAWLTTLINKYEYQTATFIAQKMTWLYGDLLRR